MSVTPDEPERIPAQRSFQSGALAPTWVGGLIIPHK